ncbi:MAG: hypothetical protein Kapaf2KO_08040 [Candidatus Kapaibacteriales bacterium]
MKVWFKDNNIYIYDAERGEAFMPLSLFPRLQSASENDRQNFELGPFGIHWPTLDEDLSYDGFYSYLKSQELIES